MILSSSFKMQIWKDESVQPTKKSISTNQLVLIYEGIKLIFTIQPFHNRLFDRIMLEGNQVYSNLQIELNSISLTLG